jgi:hypothetical protein
MLKQAAGIMEVKVERIKSPLSLLTLARCGRACGTACLGVPGWAGENDSLFEHPAETCTSQPQVWILNAVNVR